MNLKELIELQQVNLSEPIVRWLSVASKKEKYWSGESRDDWLVSVQKWLWKKQLQELKDVTYVTIIADETCDITVMEQLCICLRYFNAANGELTERIFCLREIHSQTGEVIVCVVISRLLLYFSRQYLMLLVNFYSNCPCRSERLKNAFRTKRKRVRHETIGTCSFIYYSPFALG